MDIKLGFEGIEDYVIKAEISMTYSQWKRLLDNLNRDWSDPMGSFKQIISSRLEELTNTVVATENIT